MSEANVFDAIIDGLADGKWRSVNELSTREGLRKLTITQLEMALKLLAEYDFAELGQRMESDALITEARITPELQRFWRTIKWIERGEESSKCWGEKRR